MESIKTKTEPHTIGIRTSQDRNQAVIDDFNLTRILLQSTEDKILLKMEKENTLLRKEISDVKEGLETKIESVRTEGKSNFRWTTGIMVGGVLTIVGFLINLSIRIG